MGARVEYDVRTCGTKNLNLYVNIFTCKTYSHTCDLNVKSHKEKKKTRELVKKNLHY